MKYHLLIFTALCVALATPARGVGFPNVDRPGAEGTMTAPPFALEDGRTAVLAWHNGILYSIPEVPGSAEDSNYQVRSWDFSNIAAPVEIGSHDYSAPSSRPWVFIPE